MERSPSLSEGADLATDGEIDIKEKWSGNQTLSTSLSGHFVYTVTGSLQTESLHRTAASPVSSCSHEVNGNVKSSFSNTESDRHAEPFQDYRQSEIHWLLEQIGGSGLLTVAGVSSFSYSVAVDQTYTSTADTFLVPSVGHKQLILPSSTFHSPQTLASLPGTFQLVSTEHEIADSSRYYTVNVTAHSPAWTSDVEPSHLLLEATVYDRSQVLHDRSQVLHDKSTEFHLSTITAVADTGPESGLLTVNSQFLATHSQASAESEDCTGNPPNTALNCSLSAVTSTDISRTAQSGSSSLQLDTLPVEFTYVDREHSGQIYVTGPDHALDDAVGSGLTDTSSPLSSDIQHRLTAVDTAGALSDVLLQPDAVVSLTASRGFANLSINVTSSSIPQENDTRVHNSQLTNIRNIAETSTSIISTYPLITAAESFPTRIAVSQVLPHHFPSLSCEDTVLFPVSTSTFSDAHVLDYSRIYPGQLLTTTSEEDSDQITTLATETEASGTSKLAHSGDLSIATLLREITETANILPGHDIIDNKLTDHTYPTLAKDMDISAAAPMYLQPSSTLSYDSAFFGATVQGNDNVNKLPTVFNDPLAETISLQSTTVNQALTKDTASHPAIPQTIVPALPVSISATMFIRMEKSGLSNITEVVQATERVTTTQKLNIADGETSSRQMPSFNTTIIIASACAVLALLIFVVVAICCLRRKRRSKSSASRQEGDDLWVDLYRSNSSHQMPLPSLTTCPSSFEMTDTLKSGSSGDITDNENKHSHTSEADSSVMKQMKSPRQISSFQIKNPKLEAEQLEPTQQASELAFPEDHAENWVKMAASLSMSSLPTTEVSYHTNVTDYNLAAVGKKFRAVYNYKPVCKGEMALKEGELVECRERDRNGWMLGYKPKTREEGWFPAVYVDEISCDNDLDFTCEIPETYDLLESNKLNSTDQYWTGIEHRVCYSYQSSVPGDLDIEPGQTVVVLQTLANGWWFAVSGNTCGWFPGSYVEMITDSGTEDNQANGDWCPPDNHTSASTEAQEATAAQTAEDKPDTANSSLASISELSEAKVNADADRTQSARTDVADETSKLSVNTSIAVQGGDRQEVTGATCTVDISEIEPTALLALNEQTPAQGEAQGEAHSAEGASTNSGTNISTDKFNHSQKRLEHSLRPARPAPPPPKYNHSQVKQDGKISTKTNSDIQASKPQEPVFKKPIILIHGKKPKMQQVLRSQLDEKQLNPMIRPSTRGFIPKPTAYQHDAAKNECRSIAGEHMHSNQSITSDLQGERVMFSQSHNSTGHISPFQSRGFKQLTQHEFKSSKTSLESCPETRPVYPGGSTPRSEHDKVNNSNMSACFSHERSRTPDYKREKSLTPDYKRDRSNSPILLTSGNLLHNVQRFHGAIKYPIPLGNGKGSLKSPSADKREMEIANTSSNTLSTFGRQDRSAPITVPNRKIPQIKSVHNKQTFGALHDHNSENSVNAPYNYVSLKKHPDGESMLSTNMLAIHADIIPEDMSNRKQHTPTCSNTDTTTLTRESFIITPGTVSEIVQQINKHSPLHTELQQKVKGDKRQPEPADCPTRQDILGENHAQKSLPTDQSHNILLENHAQQPLPTDQSHNILGEKHAQTSLSTDQNQNAASSSGFKDVIFDNDPSTTL